MNTKTFAIFLLTVASTLTASSPKKHMSYPAPPAWVFDIPAQEVCYAEDFRANIRVALERIQDRTYYRMWAGSLEKRGIDPTDELVAKLENEGTCHGRLLGIQKKFYQQNELEPGALANQTDAQDVITFDVIRTIYTTAFEATVLHELTAPIPDFDYRGLKDLLRSEYNEDVDALLGSAHLVQSMEFSAPKDQLVSQGSQRIHQALNSLDSQRTTLYLNVLDDSGAAVTTLLSTSQPNFYFFDSRFPGSMVPGVEEGGRFANLEQLLRSSLAYIQSVYLTATDDKAPIFIQVAIYAPSGESE